MNVFTPKNCILNTELWNMEFCSIQYIWILQYLQYIFYRYLSSMLVLITAYKQRN